MARVASVGRGAYAGPGCPRCGTFVPESVPERGDHSCWKCGQQFAMAAFAPPERAVPAPKPLQSAGAPCAKHERNAAVATCDRCGSFMCTLCRIDADGKALCATCFGRLGKAGELKDTLTGYRHYNGMAVHLAVLALFMWPLAVVLGPLAIFIALRGLRQSEKLGESLGVTGAKIAMGAGALETVGGSLAVLALFGAFK